MRWRVAPVMALALLGCACKSQKPTGLFIDSELEKLAPPDTTFATGANIEAIRTTRVFQKYLGQLKLPQLDEFTKKTGIDPRKDLQQILSCSNGKTGMFLARGKFNSGHVEGVNQFEYKGLHFFGNDQSAVMFLNSTTAAAGRTSDLRTLIDLRHQGDHGLPPALRAKLASMNPNNQVWVAFIGGLQGFSLGVSEQSNLGQLVGMLRGIENGTVGIDLRDGLAFQGHVECDTAKNAKRVHDALRGAIGLGRLSTPDNQPELLKLYDAIHVTQDQLNVNVEAQIAPELEDKFLDLWIKNR